MPVQSRVVHYYIALLKFWSILSIQVLNAVLNTHGSLMLITVITTAQNIMELSFPSELTLLFPYNIKKKASDITKMMHTRT